MPAQPGAGERASAGLSLKRAGVRLLGVEPHLAGCELVDALAADEHVAAADADLDPGHGRIAATAAVQLDDQVFQPAQLFAGRVEDRAAQELRDHHSPLLVPGRVRGRARWRTAVRGLVLVAHWFAANAVLPSPAAPRRLPRARAGLGSIIPPVRV